MSETPIPRDQTQLFGHQAAQQAFISAWNAGRLPHAWLITGAAGIGKATLAYHMARWVLAADRPATQLTLPARHHLYRQVSQATAPGLLVIEPVEREKTGGTFIISVTQVRGGFDDREGVKQNFKGMFDFFQHSSAADGWRIVIIDQADQLNENAQNAVLKILEEPPVRALILLTTSQPGKLLPTIRSRCRHLGLQPLNEGELQQAARAAHIDLPANSSAVLRAANGSIGELARLQQLDVTSLDSQLDSLLKTLPQVDWQKLHELAGKVSRKEAEPQFDLLLELLASKMQARFTEQPAASLPGQALQQKINAIKFAHLDRTASLIEIFNYLQKTIAAANRAA